MIANYHTHTWRCNHASGTEREYVDAAIDTGIQVLGFSDHTPYFFPGDYYSYFRMRPEQLEDYVNTILGLQQEYRNRIQIPVGLEVEYYPELFPQLLPVLRDQPLQYLILGQHALGNELGEPYTVQPTDDTHMLARYCSQVLEGVQTGLFTYVAHPDIFRFIGEDKIYETHMRAMCRELVSCGIPLEINMLGLRDHRHYPRTRFWEIAAEENASVVLGMDAHDVSAFYEKEAEHRAMDMIRRLGLTFVPVPSLRPIR